MLHTILALCVIIFYMGAFVCLGCLLPARVHGCRPVNLLIIGFFMYFAAFHVMALPMKLMHLRLHVLSLSWFAFLGLVLLFVIIRRRSMLGQVLVRAFTKPDRYALCFMAFSAALIVLLVLNVNHISDWDASYYIGLPASSKFSDTIELMNPYSGRLRDDFKSFYQLNTDTVHAAVIYQILRLPPLIHAKFTFTAVTAAVFCMLLYRAGEFLTRRPLIPLFGIGALAVLLFSYSIAGVSHYFAYRTYEGKSICAFLYTTMIFVSMLAVYFRKEEAWGWWCLFFVGLGGISFCNTALILLPFMTGTLLLPSVVFPGPGDLPRVPGRWKKLAGVLVPCVIWLVLYRVL